MITVERNHPDGLQREVWRFIHIDNHSDVTLYLDVYSCQSRPTKRHNWKINPATRDKPSPHYSRLNHRDSGLTLEQVPLPEDVAQEAKEQFVSGVVVKKWDRQ